MPCSCDEVVDCPIICNCNIPTYTEDATYTGIDVNVAVLEQKINTIKEEEAHIVQLNAQYISYASFQAMFFKNSIKFNPLNGVYAKNTYWQEFLANKYRHIVYSSINGSIDTFEQNQIQDESFNLLNTIIRSYEYDLNISSECWDTCSLIEFTTTLSNIVNLTDVGNECNIKCSITLDDFFENLEAQGLVIDASSGLPLDPSGGTLIYTGLVNALITASFRSCTPCVKDVKIKWPFLINFNSVTAQAADGSNNTANFLGSVGDASNNWPNIYFAEGSDGNKTVPVIYRSGGIAPNNELRYDTVDISGNRALITVGQNIPAYSRYNAYLYSNIR
jgi:hypothetical protein